MIETPPEGFIKSRFNTLASTRNKYRDRARDYAKVTIPYLMPEVETGTDSSEFQNDYNTEGAKLVNALANRYMSTLFPAGKSFVKLGMQEQDLQETQQKTGKNKADVDAIFAEVERLFRKKFEAIGSRSGLLDALRHLIVTGNALVHKPKDGKVVTYAIDEYVMLRSLDGTVTEIITEDKKLVMLLDAELQAQVIAELDLTPEDLPEQTVSLYTYIRLNPENNKQWLVDQAVDAIPVGTQNSYTEDSFRWFPLVWNRTRRETYGRGLVEDHYGSFWTLSILSEALAVGAVTLADIKFLVRPGSMIDIPELNAAATGTFHYGEQDDINAITSDKQRDIILIKDVMDRYTRHLGEVFMYMPSTMRDAERVTAEENRIRANALENTHTGVYSTLSEDLQYPFSLLIFNEMGITKMLDSNVEIEITTGLSALSRGAENDKINHWIDDLTRTNNVPEDARGRLKMSDFMKVTAAGRDIAFNKFIMTDDEFQALQEQQAQAQAAAQAQGEASVQQGMEPQQ